MIVCNQAALGRSLTATSGAKAAVDVAFGAAHDSGVFEAKPTARADMTAGALHALAGDCNWVYYGQVTPEKKIGFFRRRDHKVAAPALVLAERVMTVITVGYPSITRALRSGHWTKLGRFPIAAELNAPRPSVQWPVGTLTVTVCERDAPEYDTRVEDPSIQNMELMMVLDAVEHVPQRLTADFGAEEADWHVGGPIWRERRFREEMAKRSDQPWSRLPDDWVPTTKR